MGNTSGNQRHKSAGLIAPSSPTKEVQSQAFVFDKNTDSNALHEPNPLFTKNTSKPNVCLPNVFTIFCFRYLFNSNLIYLLTYLMFSIHKDDDFIDGIPRSMSANDTENKMLPTVFRWEGGGKQVFISGTFSEWKPIPMVQR